MYTLKNDDFISQIKENLKTLNPKEILFFSWLCAVRALPFLGADGTIDFWLEKFKEKYLYNVLHSLDISSASIDSIRIANVIDVATATIVADDEAAYIDGNNGIKSVVKAAAYTSYVAYVAYADLGNTDAAITAASDVAGYSKGAAEYYKVNLSHILLEDLKHIRESEYASFHHDIKLYGPIWGNFQNALLKVGCEYWGKLYANLFECGFLLSTEALEHRVNVPVEIQEQGARVVGLYLEKLEAEGGRCLNEARIIILGEKGAGKTCLARRLNNLNAAMTEKDESTEGVSITLWKMNSSVDTSMVNVRIWDFAGHVITHAAHRCFLSERSLYIIVYDGRTEERNRLAYWLDHVRNYGNGAPVRILVNIFDDHKPDIPENSLKEKYPFIKDFVYLSINHDKDEMKVFRKKTAELIQTNPFWNCLVIPETYFRVKEILEQRFQKNSEIFYHEHIEKDVFDQIALENNIGNNDTEQLLKDLHELGVCLWYKGIDKYNTDTLVLNPDWISHGIYRLINWAHNNAKHTVSLDDYENIFKEEKSRYPKKKLSFIFRLMKKYELAYSRENDDVIIIPFLLKEDQPDNLPLFSIEDSLLIQYAAEQPLPPNTVSRLIVRHNEDIESNHMVWRHGVVLNYKNNTISLVKEDDRKIIIKAKGDNKSEYIAKLRNSMDDIFNSYKSDKPELQYKIIVNESVVTTPFEKNEDKSLMLSDEIIKRYIANGRMNYYYPQGNVDIPLEQTVNVYNINAPNATFQIFNFNHCNFTLQGELRSLINSFHSTGNIKEAKALEIAVEELERIEELDSKKDIIKSGGLIKLKKFLEEVNNENSSVSKVLHNIKHGVKTAQNIAKTYNDIAQWLGLPQVPKPFLGK